MEIKIDNYELEKLKRILYTMDISEKIIKALCKVDDLSNLNKVQYNYLLYIICLK